VTKKKDKKKQDDTAVETSADDMLAYLKEHTGLTDEDFSQYEDDEEMLKEFYDEVRGTVDEPEKATIVDTTGRALPDKPDKPDEPEIEDGPMLEVGGRKVPSAHVIVNKTELAERGYDNVIVEDPDGMTGMKIDVVFERRPEIHPDYPVAVEPDYRVRAQVLYDVVQAKKKPTSITNVTRIAKKKGFESLDPAQSKADVQRMVSWLKMFVAGDEDIDALSKRLVGA